MAVVHGQDSGYAQEMRKWNAHHSEFGPPGRPFVFHAFPVRMYKAARSPEGVIELTENHRANDETERQNFESRGFAVGPQGAVDALLAREQRAAVAHAELNADVRKMSVKAQDEYAQVEAAAGIKHLDAVPETPDQAPWATLAEDDDVTNHFLSRAAGKGVPMAFSQGGVLNPADDYNITGDWTFDGDVTFTGSVTDTGTTLVSPTISGTVAGGASYTAPTLTSPVVTGALTYTGTPATETNNLNAALTITAATSGTRRLVKSAITIDTTGNTFSVSGGGSIAAVRGEQTLAATDTFTDGFLYGVQGKFTMNGTMNETAAARITGVLGQVDLTTGTLTDGQISAVWGDLQGSAPTLTVNDQLYVGRWTNSMGTGKKAQAFHLMYGAADFFLEASADGGSADWGVIGAGTYSTADGYLKVSIYGTTYRMPLFLGVD